jgi:hypothetical protein
MDNFEPREACVHRKNFTAQQGCSAQLSSEPISSDEFVHGIRQVLRNTLAPSCVTVTIQGARNPQFRCARKVLEIEPLCKQKSWILNCGFCMAPSLETIRGNNSGRPSQSTVSYGSCRLAEKYILTKRVCDVVGSIFPLIALLPLCLVVAVFD